jgi:1,4-dihydroxy-2-naphthoate octaprenyltransferase
MILAVLIFLVIFANEFPDFEADKAVNKKTLVVTFGIKKAVILYKVTVSILCILAVIYSIISLNMLISAVLLIPIIGISALSLKNANAEKLVQNGFTDLSRATILLHTIGGVGLFAAVLLA